MAWLETDFRPGDPLHRIKARWLSEVANALNTLDVELHDDLSIPYVERNYPGKWIIHLPAPGKGGGGAATPFNHRWRVTVAEDGASRTLRVEPGSLWRNDGAGVVDLGVAPDGETVTEADDGSWAVQSAGSGSLYVADASPAPLLVWGDPTSETRAILLRVADLVVASSGTTLVQRAVGDQLYSVGGGAAPETLRFLQVRLREVPVGSSGETQQMWCVWLGRSIPFEWVSRQEGGTAPWEYSDYFGSIPRWSEAAGFADGWLQFATPAQVQGLEVGAAYGIVLNFPHPDSAEAGDLPGFSVEFVGAGVASNPPSWNAETRALTLPFFRVVERGGVKVFENTRLGDVSIQVSAAEACNLLLKRDGEWSATTSNEVQIGDEYAIAQWRALRVRCHNLDGSESSYDVSLKPSLLADSGTPCVSHAVDHLDGLTGDV